MGDEKARQAAHRAVADKNACTAEEPPGGFRSDSDTAIDTYLDFLKTESEAAHKPDDVPLREVEDG